MSGAANRPRRRRTVSLRTRLLAGVLVPGSIVFAFAAVTGFRQVADAQARLDRATTLLDSIADSGLTFFPLLLAERDASVRYLGDPTTEAQARQDLDGTRAQIDVLVGGNRSDLGPLLAQLPAEAQQTFAAYGTALDQLRATRQKVDTRSLDARGAVLAFAPLTDVMQQGGYVLGPVAGSSAIGARITRSSDIQRAADLLDRASTLTVAELRAQRVDAATLANIAQLRGAYSDLLDRATPLLEPADRDTVTALRASPRWQSVEAAIESVAAPGQRPDIDPAVLEADGKQVSSELLRTGTAASRAGWTAEADDSRAVLAASIRDVVLLMLGLLLATTVTAVVASRLVRRLGRLRRETLALADGTLPETVARLRRGERIDIDTDVPPLESGDDEIGQVAAAFNHAQRTAVRAAADEATTRAGFNNAFLNIARRSQGILQQQIEVLDQVERAETDPEQLRLLFRLDHLTTRERRNAENLIILGGEQPRRRWRNPVALGELVRGAIGESEYYQRVHVGRLPDARIAGPAVGDLVHLLAELIDNATAFSPPGAPIEVRATIVGRGIAVEVEDHGLGMEEGQLEQLNETLRNPPDFGLLALSGDSRIGLFVVAWLARKHGMAVMLRRSVYGGVLAGVLVPTDLVVGDEPAEATPQPVAPLPAQRGAERVPVRAAPAALASVAPAPSTTAALPRLPRRRRQEQLSPQLRTGPEALEEAGAAQAPAPEVTRSRMAALQQGSVAARRSRGAEPTPEEER